MAPEEHTLGQRAAVEFIGVFSIVFFGAGAVVLDILTAPPKPGPRRSFSLDSASARSKWVGIGLAFWVAIAMPIYLFGHVSGQHINLAVTFALWLTDRIDGIPAVVYIIAQLAGGIAGGLVFYLIHLNPALVEQALMGATLPFPGISVWQALLTEIIITFFLMVAVMAMVIDDRTPDQLAGLVIGLVVAVGVMVVGNVSGASFNPARTIGPYVTNTVVSFFGTNVNDPALWQYVWIYIFGPESVLSSVRTFTTMRCCLHTKPRTRSERKRSGDRRWEGVFSWMATTQTASCPVFDQAYHPQHSEIHGKDDSPHESKDCHANGQNHLHTRAIEE